MKKTALVLGMAAALTAGMASAHQAGDVIVRGGGILVMANSTSSTKTATEVKLDVNNNAQFGLTGTYMFTDNIGLELLAATPFSHKISANVPALQANSNLGDVAKVKHLPPSLYLQYYFLDKDAGSRPYIGAGLNYTRFFDPESTNPAITNLKVKKHSFGPVVNAGIDIKLTDNLYLNTAMWYTHIRTNASFDALKGNHEVKIKLDPVIFFAGLAYSF
ncbi:outer membrane protein [Cricetibacter osteomyelitidis]|uniref:Outer membrane protein n=1 Tax=Cricetibacter osteomyelitidis TaxID=1521931 RepID=A0A4R2SYV1_9PAST|nr:OmpW family outer membrane protein [Cricetibacter osteomyelitidis]TCP95729.1 outer membrane protein [Cricetibacter osteomyelitidis]